MPLLVTGISQSGDLLGFLTGVMMEGICSLRKNIKLLDKYGVEQISPGTNNVCLKFKKIYITLNDFSVRKQNFESKQTQVSFV